ncbi:MAG: ChaN family lipoprotein [Nitrospirae bacterium]|nr:ChaN family lipoprotein [Nitrospirota bacterium]
MLKNIKHIGFSVIVFILFNALQAGAEESQKSAYPVNSLSISFDVKNNLLKGREIITLPDDREMAVYVGNLKILSTSFNGKPMDYRIQEGQFKVTGKGTLEINYEGVFKGDTPKKNPENAGVVSTGIVSDKGISLTDNWYPSIKELAYYKLVAVVPENFLAVSEADEITFRNVPFGREYTFNMGHPLNGINFIAGNYKEKKHSANGIDIYAYFFEEDAALADKYVEYARKYLKFYDGLLTPYPYKRFSVVENIFSTGYSMPGYTLLGKDVIRLPFIPETSLGHEIAHQWFGNYVYADFQKGNWLEAITTYLSDHLYEEQKGKGWEYRKNILVNFQGYVTSDKDFPLKDFSSRTDFATMAIGYGKGAMLFHMLKGLTGEEIFYKSLRKLINENKFKIASWTDIQKAFEQESGKDLDWFFTQWLNRKGVPSLKINDPRERVLKGEPLVSFELLQEGSEYKFTLPIKITAEKSEVKELMQVEKGKQYFSLPTNENPEHLIVDENYDIMRKLSYDEFPPVIARLAGDESRIIVYREKEKDKYSTLIETLKEEGFSVKEEKELKDEDIKKSSLLALGFESQVLKRLFGKIDKPDSGFVLIVRNNPLNTSKVVAYASGDSKEEVDPVVNKILHYGKYSVIRFEKGRNVEKDITETNRGVKFSLSKQVQGIEPKKTLNLQRIIDNVSDKPIIFVGERHSYYEDHKVELAVIKGLFKKGKKFAIGMEMFQRPFQKAIDDYISGAINEKDFLKKTEYFKRWNIDFNLYREIIEFAKAKGIPIIALNLKAELMKKTEQSGLDGLSEEERKEVPQDMDMSDDSYRQRLKEIFETHPSGSSFDYFYQSQILWDETMAHSIAEFMKERPDYQMVVLAGGQHIMYESGIPQRVNRLTGKKYATLVTGDIDNNIGDYVLFPDSLKPPFSAKLGIVLKKDEDGVFIDDFSKDSAALKSGIKKGDIILSVDDWKVETVEDVRIALFDKNPGDSVKVKIVRKRFLLKDKELEFEIAL